MKPKQHICIAEDHTILREGLCALLASDTEFEVDCVAEDGFEVIQCIQKCRSDLVLLDLSMPRLNGLEAIQEIKKRSPNTKILVLTVHNAEEYILSALQAGADGYVLKDTTHTELVLAIKSVLSGKVYISPSVSEKLSKAIWTAENPCWPTCYGIRSHTGNGSF